MVLNKHFEAETKRRPKFDLKTPKIELFILEGEDFFI